MREGQKHVCEVQLVHSTMLRAREDFHGHQVYDRVRNADELIAFQYRAYCRRLNCNTALQWALWVPRIERAENFTLHPKTGALLKVRLFAESDLALLSRRLDRRKRVRSLRWFFFGGTGWITGLG